MPRTLSSPDVDYVTVCIVEIVAASGETGIAFRNTGEIVAAVHERAGTLDVIPMQRLRLALADAIGFGVRHVKTDGTVTFRMAEYA